MRIFGLEMAHVRDLGREQWICCVDFVDKGLVLKLAVFVLHFSTVIGIYPYSTGHYIVYLTHLSFAFMQSKIDDWFLRCSWQVNFEAKTVT